MRTIVGPAADPHIQAMKRGGIAFVVCALIGITVSYLLKDVTADIFLLGTASSAAGGLLGGAIGKVLK